MKQENVKNELKRVHEIVNDFQEERGVDIFDSTPYIEMLASLYRYKDNQSKGLAAPLNKREESDGNKEKKLKVKAILARYIKDLASLIGDEDVNYLSDHYTSVVDYCLSSIDFGRKSIIQDIPGIAQFVSAMMDLNDKKSIYNPFAYVGKLITENPCCDFLGVENDELIWALAQINLDAHKSKSEIILEDPSLDLVDESRKFDTVIMDVSDSSSNEEALTDFRNALKNKLKEGGTLLALLPNFFSARFEDYRRSIVESRSLVSVVELPREMRGKLLNAVLVIAQKKQIEEVMLLDARSFICNKENSYDEKFDYQSAVEEVKNDQGIRHKNVRIADLKEDCNLTPSRYLYQLPQSPYPLQPFSAIIEILPLKFTSEKSYIVSPDSFKSKIRDCELRFSDLETYRKGPRKRIIDQDCILLSLQKFDFIKVRHLIEQKLDLPFGFSRVDILPFKVRKELDITEDYLLYALKSDFVQSQVREFTRYDARISQKRLLTLMIPVPPLEIQERLVKEQYAKEISKLEQEVLDNFNAYKKDIHLKKHALGQTLFVMGNWWKILMDVKEKSGHSLNLDEVVVDNGIHKMTINDVFQTVGYLMRKVSHGVNRFTAGDEFMETTNFNLVDFMRDYLRKNTANNYTFECVLPDNEDIKTKEIQFSKPGLEQILNNIENNAVKHGFEGRTHNVIRILFEQTDDSLDLLISNNGAPLHPQMKTTQVFEYGKSSRLGSDNHDGLGAYEVKAIMRKFGGDAEFISQPESDFPVTYKLKFNQH